MILFPDTSFLCSLYREQRGTLAAVAWMERFEGKLPVSTLLLFEFRQSVRLQTRLFASDRSRGFQKAKGIIMLRDLQIDLAENSLRILPVDWPDVHRIAEELSSKYTESGGHRFADILHVATAVHLGAEQFLTFDGNQKTLAEAEGMEVPF